MKPWISLVLLTGCSTLGTPINEITLPSGTPGYTVSCGGNLQDWNACYRAASSVCKGSGYEILSQTGATRPMLVSFPSGYKRSGTTVASGIVTRSMLIQCE